MKRRPYNALGFAVDAGSGQLRTGVTVMTAVPYRGPRRHAETGSPCPRQDNPVDGEPVGYRAHHSGYGNPTPGHARHDTHDPVVDHVESGGDRSARAEAARAPSPSQTHCAKRVVAIPFEKAVRSPIKPADRQHAPGIECGCRRGWS
jgi:hypothetical protein